MDFKDLKHASFNCEFVMDGTSRPEPVKLDTISYKSYDTCFLLAFFVVEGQLYVRDQSLISSDDFGCCMNGKTKLSDISSNDEEETMKSRNQTWAKMNTLAAQPIDENWCWTPQKSTVETSRSTVWGSPGPNRSEKFAHQFQTFLFSWAVVSSLKLTSLITKAFTSVEWDQNLEKCLPKRPFSFFVLEGSSVSDTTGATLSILAVRQRRLRARPETAGFRSIRIFCVFGSFDILIEKPCRAYFLVLKACMRWKPGKHCSNAMKATLHFTFSSCTTLDRQSTHGVSMCHVWESLIQTCVRSHVWDGEVLSG